MSRRVTLLDLIGHPVTQGAVQQLAQGVDPRLVAARIAGDAIRDHVAKSLGAPVQKKAGPRIDSDDIIDGEFTVIDVTPGVKQRKKVG